MEVWSAYVCLITFFCFNKPPVGLKRNMPLLELSLFVPGGEEANIIYHYCKYFDFFPGGLNQIKVTFPLIGG